MRVGILTFHCADNYGAMLQAYATLHFLRSVGLETDIINYQPQFLNNPYKPWNFKRMIASKRPLYLIPAIFNEITLYARRKARKKSFEAFFDKYIIEGRKNIVSSIPDKYDVYIVGSDQVWNQDITLEPIDAYFCRFDFAHTGRKYIAYAASLGKSLLTDSEANYFKANLANFDALSVRETNAKDILQPYVDKKIHVVLDPTLLLNKTKWDELASSSVPSGKYVLVYQVREHSGVLKTARRIADELGATIVQLVAWPSHNASPEYQTKNPQDFVSLIKNAACVVTTSFHATSFSIIFEVPFYVVKLGDGKDGRSESLLNICGLPHRMISISEDFVFSEIEYSDVRIRLEKERQKSREFLLNAIGYE